MAVLDRQTFRIGGRLLRAVATPGHANHHVYVDEACQLAFTGDAAGRSLPGCLLVHPPTPPPDLDLDAWEASLDRLESLKLRRLCLTHFGVRGDPPQVFRELRRRLREVENLLLEGWQAGQDADQLADRLRAYLQVELLARCGGPADRHQGISAGYRLDVLGYMRYFEKRCAVRR